MGDAGVFYQQRFHVEGGDVLLQFPEIGAIVEVTEGFGGPIMFVCMRINDEHMAAGAHYAAQFTEDGARTHYVVQEHMTHGDIYGTCREREALGHAFTEGDMLVSRLGHLLPGPGEHGG